MNEAQFTETVIAYATLRGWKVAHFRPAVDRGKWRTAMSGDPGFPDLVLARAGRVVFAELKSASGKLRPQQEQWLSALHPKELVGHTVHVWRPIDLPRIKEVLH